VQHPLRHVRRPRLDRLDGPDGVDAAAVAFLEPVVGHVSVDVQDAEL
jgi:hypothetical protein